MKFENFCYEILECEYRNDYSTLNVNIINFNTYDIESILKRLSIYASTFSSEEMMTYDDNILIKKDLIYYGLKGIYKIKELNRYVTFKFDFKVNENIFNYLSNILYVELPSSIFKDITNLDVRPNHKWMGNYLLGSLNLDQQKNLIINLITLFKPNSSNILNVLNLYTKFISGCSIFTIKNKDKSIFNLFKKYDIVFSETFYQLHYSNEYEQRTKVGFQNISIDRILYEDNIDLENKVLINNVNINLYLESISSNIENPKNIYNNNLKDDSILKSILNILLSYKLYDLSIDTSLNSKYYLNNIYQNIYNTEVIFDINISITTLSGGVINAFSEC